MDELTHMDDQGRARMVDVGGKDATHRVATAEAVIALRDDTRRKLMSGGLPKGDALSVARIAAIQAVKKTAELIPLCHPIPLSGIDVDITEVPEGARIEVTVRTTAPTGVEMEAMTGAALGAMTLYDMVKGVDRGAQIGPVRLLAKSGGRSGEWTR
jgi:cyclic pyranopterin phosphate synthase